MLTKRLACGAFDKLRLSGVGRCKLNMGLD
jgi:hypothetical protein